jgi:hypothetical protein
MATGLDGKWFWYRRWQQERERLFPLRAARRYLALSLPRWATDCLRRADPALAGALDRPLVLWERQKGAMRLVAVDALCRPRPA